MLISEYLDSALAPARRVRELEALASRVAARPAGDVLADLEQLLVNRRISGEDSRRLNLLLSQLYHAHADVDVVAISTWRERVATAWELTRSHHLLNGRG